METKNRMRITPHHQTDADIAMATRLANLAETKNKIVSMQSEQALETILSAPSPAALIHSFGKQDFYFLIHDIGIEDSIELLSLASADQWEYIMDMETWEKDRVQMDQITRWIGRLLMADSERLVKWAIKEKNDLITLFLSNAIDVQIREHDQDPSDIEDDFSTVDDIFYVRIRNNSLDSDETDPAFQRHSAILTEFFKQLADFDHKIYQSILLESASVISSEAEEEAFRMRGTRLAEQGLPPFHEAISIYQPMRKSETLRRPLESAPSQSMGPGQSLIYLPRMVKGDNLFARTLATIDPTDAALHSIRNEFTTLCNQIVIADLKTIRDKTQLRESVKKASGYLSCGMERLLMERRPPVKRHGGRLSPDQTAPNEIQPDELQPNEIQPNEIEKARAILKSVSLFDLFKTGYSLATSLKQKASTWRENSWHAAQGLTLDFWDEKWMGILGGLHLKRPLYFENRRKENVLYREFFSLNDIDETEKEMDAIIQMDGLLSRLPIHINAFGPIHLTWKNIVLTLWAKNHLAIPEKETPLKPEQLALLFESLWPESDTPARIKESMKKLFLQWLSESAKMDMHEISQNLGEVFEALFEEVEREYGNLKKEAIDPRYIRLFILA